MKTSAEMKRQVSLGVLVTSALLLGACGGGGGGSASPSPTPPAAPAPPATVSSLGCSDVQSSTTGFSMGLCENSAGVVGGVLKNYNVTVTKTAGSALGVYNFSLASLPVGSGSGVTTLTGENCLSSTLGSKKLYTTAVLDVANQTTGPYWVLQAINPTAGANNALVCGTNSSREAAAFPLAFLDAGFLERQINNRASPPTTTYVGGWVTALNATGDTAPTSPKTFANGGFLGKQVILNSGFASFDGAATASVSGSTITINLADAAYPQGFSALTNSQRFGVITMTGTISGNTVSGTLSGVDRSGNASAVSGNFEGIFGGAGAELAIRYGVRFTTGTGVATGIAFFK